MSHFTVLVFGDDVEKALAPFHEFESTGIDDEYVRTIDVTDGCLQDYNDSTYTLVTLPDGSEVFVYECLEGGFAKDLYPDFPRREVRVKDEQSFEVWLADNGVRLLEEPYRAGDGGFGMYRFFLTEGGKTTVYRRTNPNKKWDWYSVGGRWDGWLTTRDGKAVNSCAAAELDFEHMCQQQVDAALKLFDAVSPAWTRVSQDGTKETVAIPEFQTFLDATTGEDGSQVEDPKRARELYSADPVIAAIAALEKEHDLFHMEEHRSFWAGGDREAFIRKTRVGATPYAFLLDGEWVSRGTMLMFGMSTDEDEGYYDKFVAALEKVAREQPEMRVTLVDCHI